jgi:ADP-L-glycero-D-manno-heptose 6-epimerase
MIYITGGSGFIGTNLIKYFNNLNIFDIIVVDYKEPEQSLKIKNYITPSIFLTLLPTIKNEEIIHLGAITDTLCNDSNLLTKENINYSTEIIDYCSRNNNKCIYASSASVYGNGNNFQDGSFIGELRQLHPINLYAQSKLQVDAFASYFFDNSSLFGLRFFNVFGPYDYKKGNMSNFICKNFNKFKNKEPIKLFKMNTIPQRDFIYVTDVCYIIYEFLNKSLKPSIYNVGTGISNTWEDFCKYMYIANGHEFSNELIQYIEPIFSLNGYQYFTKADISKLRMQIQYIPTTLKKACYNYVQSGL